MRKYLTEFVGTFFLVLTIGSVVMAPNDAGAMAPLAIGAVLMAMIFAGGHVSGAHYNPAVTVAVFLRGKCGASDVPGYLVAQFAAAAAAAFTVAFLKGNPLVAPMQIDLTRALVAEFLYTFALCSVVLNVATCRGTSGNSFYGLAIGFTVLAGAYSVGAVSGGAFNPAVAFGATLMGLFSPANIWVYLVANFAAAAAAAAFFKLIDAEGPEPTPQRGA
ncbi:MAG TPA: aquaporin [Vicinamibacterales bacterium]|nr:aquaporin [Vicinamibacterales bacterium]